MAARLGRAAGALTMPARGLVVDGRRFARWMLAVAALLAFDAVACRAAPQAAPSNSSRASASAAPAGLSEPRPAAPDANTSLGDFSAIVNSFPEADVHEGIGREGFGAALREVLEAIARRGDAGAPPDIAFVVDRDTPEPLAGALVVAMARNRELLVTSGRFALVSCGRSDGMWKA